MTRSDGAADPGHPESSDEETVDERFVEDSPVAPEEVAVDESTAAAGLGGTEADSVEDAPEAESPEARDTEQDSAEEAEPVDELTALQTELDERTDDLKRVTAEFTNYRRRVERDRESVVESAKGSVLSELLPMLDDLERAREHGDLTEGPLKSFADQLSALMVSQGVEQFGVEDEPFDPQIHEAVQDESDGGEQKLGTVLRKGYRLGSRVLRTAMVIVN